VSAQFMNQQVEPPMDGFNAMGHPIPYARQQAGFETCIDMGLDKARAYEVVAAVSEQLKRDKPYEALEQGCKFLDLVGSYRLMAVLLTA
jgi:hypothetical protein